MYPNGWGELTRDDMAGAWEATALIPAFAGYGQQLVRVQAPGREFELESFEEHSDRRAELFAEGRFPVIVLDAEGEGPSTEQEAAFHRLLEEDAALGAAVLEALVDDYRKRWEERRSQREPFWPEEDLDTALPEINSAEDLRDLIRLQQVTLHEAEEGEPACIGLTFECAWDPDHGLGVCLCGDQVVQVGEAESAREPLLAAA